MARMPQCSGVVGVAAAEPKQTASSFASILCQYAQDQFGARRKKDLMCETCSNLNRYKTSFMNINLVSLFLLLNADSCE